MQEFKIWNKEFPFYNSEIANEENEGINYLQFYGVEAAAPAPVVVIFPGGGYKFRSNVNEGEAIARFFNGKGIAAAVVQYRVNPYTYPAPLLDAQRAIKILRYNAKELNINPDRLFTIGFSAGGHLCGMTATFPDICNIYNDEIDKMSHKPTGAILGYPVITCDENIWHSGSFRNLLGENYDKREEFSLEKRVDKDTCPCFVFHCAYDGLVPKENSLVFAKALWGNGIHCELHIFPEGGHGGGLRAVNLNSRVWPELAADWILRFGKPDMPE